jgi:hypothetical protein
MLIVFIDGEHVAPGSRRHDSLMVWKHRLRRRVRQRSTSDGLFSPVGFGQPKSRRDLAAIITAACLHGFKAPDPRLGFEPVGPAQIARNKLLEASEIPANAARLIQ